MTSSTPACGVGYSDISPGCSACATNYYPELGACVACPPGSSSKAVIIGYFVLGSLLAFLGLFGAVFLIQRTAGKASVGTSLFRARDLVVWVLVTWQTILQVGKRMSAAPELVRRVFAVLSILQLDSTAVLHPSCYSGNPFSSQLMALAGSFATICSVVCLFMLPLTRIRQLTKVVGALRRIGLSMLVLLYPLVCNTALNMVHCTHDSDGSLRLASNPLFVCYSGPHLRVGMLAWLAVVLHVVGFPVLTFTVLWRQRDKLSSVIVRAPVFEATWGGFIAQDFQPAYFWFVHINLFTVFVLSVLLVFASTASSLGTQAGVFIASIALVALNAWAVLSFRPYIERKQWKEPVKHLALSVTAVSALANLLGELYIAGSISRTGSTVVAYVLLVLIIVLIVTFLVKFFRFVWQEAEHTSQVQLLKSVTASPTASGLPCAGTVDAREVVVALNPMHFEPAVTPPASSAQGNQLFRTCIRQSHDHLLDYRGRVLQTPQMPRSLLASAKPVRMRATDSDEVVNEDSKFGSKNYLQNPLCDIQNA